MLIAYYSLTGNVRRFVAKTGLATVEIKPGLMLAEPFVCVTGTYGFGQVAGTVSDFLADNSDYLAVAVKMAPTNVTANRTPIMRVAKPKKIRTPPTSSIVAMT